MTEYITREELDKLRKEGRFSRKVKRMRRRLEHVAQCALIVWANSGHVLDHYPELEWLYANPLGGYRPPKVAAEMKAEGAKAGVPDLTLPVPKGGAHGLYIEMKIGDNKPTEDQRRWINFLRSQGYRVEVCYGEEEAKEVLISYLTGGGLHG